jgi:hypothetical protein
MTRVGDSALPFPLDRAIEKIVRGAHRKVDPGPAADLSPAESQSRPLLEQLFALPNLEDYLASELAPCIADPSLLLPGRFEQALREGLDALLAAEQEDPRNAHLFRRATRLMREQSELRDLVQMYRQALLKG